jgi:hypothetical protein
MKKIYLGVLVGLIIGIIDVIPMIFMNLTWNADLSALSMWIISGFLIATSNIKLKDPLKGVVISILMFIPVSFIIAFQYPASVIPVIITTVIFGALLGLIIGKFGK